MTEPTYHAYLEILGNELRPALGCTEPIAIAYAAAKARSVLGSMPKGLSLRCSGNIIKNVKGVVVPNSGGLRGIEVAATLGVVGGDSEKQLEVLGVVSSDDVARTKELVAAGYCSCSVVQDVPALFIEVEAVDCGQRATVTIERSHTNITKIEKNGQTIFSQGKSAAPSVSEDLRRMLSVTGIIEFAEQVDIRDIKEVLDRQIRYNEAIASEGLSKDYGIGIGRILLKRYDSSDVRIRARAKAAAGSDARMSGCPLPVVINSGSGNQGLTVSLPVMEFAKEWQASYEDLLKALAVANLIAIHQKRYIGSLSAFCGAVCAATGAACGISFLHGGRYEEISRTITDTLANIGGIVCDGAKPSCAAKISSALDAAILGFEMGTKERKAFGNGEGLVKQNVEATIRSFGRVGAQGMKGTDQEIIRIMME
ncbi:MAG: serine dehydratase subunit alpha family protein [Sphaerochaetaceae bacterium]|jgi:L-cysteine desulfidase